MKSNAARTHQIQQQSIPQSTTIQPRITVNPREPTMFKPTVITLLISAVATSAIATSERCTTTINEPYAGCCEAAAHRTTMSVDCHGCVLQTLPAPKCDIACPTPRTIASSTYTETVCKPTTIEPIETYAPTTTITPIETETTFTTYVTPRAVTVGPSGPERSSCTSTFYDTYTGCCAPRPVTTSYEVVDCNGCVGANIPAAQCDIACSTTVTDLQFTSTKTFCAPSSTAYARF